MLFKAHELATAMCPAGWTRVRLAEIAQEVSVRAGHDTALPVLSVTKHRGIVKAEDYFSKAVHGRDTSNYKIVRSGDFAYATIHLDEGSLGRHTDTPSGIVSPMYTVFEVTAGFDPYYLETLLRSPKSIVTYGSLGQGTVNRRASISFSAFSGLVLQHPPLPEQKKIAAILSSVDEVIAKTEAVIAQLQTVKKAMMEQLLTKGMPGRHTRFKQTEIGEIPEEWEVVELSVVTTRITKGESPNWQGFAYQDQGTVFVTSENVRDGFLLLDPLKFVPIEFANKVRRSRLASGDILVNLVGASIGRACIWSGEFLDANVNQAVAVISPEKTLVHSRWILEMLYTAHGQRYFGLSKVDSARPNVSLANLREFPLPLPSLAEQSEIVGIAASLVESMRLEERALKCLQSLKTALSSSLLSGEIRVIPEVAE